LIVSDPRTDPPERLRRRAVRHGYLCVRRLVDPKNVEYLRARAVETGAGLGWLTDEGRATEPGRGPVGHTDSRWLEWQSRMASAAELHLIVQDRAVIRMLESVTAQTVEPVPAQVFRAMEARRAEAVTPPHQDGFYLGSSVEKFWVAWLPLQRCPLELGPLALLRGSHRGGLLPHSRAPGGGDGAVLPAGAADAPWDAGPLESGDVLLFHQLTLHRSCPNRTADQYRLSFDYRLRLTGP
jgi:ectoine hydroxylase-related dioxygenase (phytanoyl-CoA dioxygenase family)